MYLLPPRWVNPIVPRQLTNPSNSSPPISLFLFDLRRLLRFRTLVELLDQGSCDYILNYDSLFYIQHIFSPLHIEYRLLLIWWCLFHQIKVRSSKQYGFYRPHDLSIISIFHPAWNCGQKCKAPPLPPSHYQFHFISTMALSTSTVDCKKSPPVKTKWSPRAKEEVPRGTFFGCGPSAGQDSNNPLTQQFVHPPSTSPPSLPFSFTLAAEATFIPSQSICETAHWLIYWRVVKVYSLYWLGALMLYF